MSHRFRYGLRWVVLGLLSGAILFQVTCATSLATGTAGILNSITNSLITNYVNKALNVPTFNFSSLTT